MYYQRRNYIEERISNCNKLITLSPDGCLHVTEYFYDPVYAARAGS